MKTLSVRMLLGGAIFALTLSMTATAQTNSTTASGQTSVTGCLSGPNDEGAYILKPTKGRAFEVGGNDQLKEHVGHTVRLTGNWVKSGAAIGENESAEKNEKSEGKEHHGVAERHFKVSDIHHISASCSQGGATGGTPQ
ncbi:MAG TPA: hypothetical protein VFJ10_09850 [Acidobacteriaceae bacterium]|jgi:hypothetical protein|nr:hypothetical protein [Acidobacteriaceae bacterium]